MRRVITFYFLLAVAFVSAYCYVVIAWTDVKAVGLHAFPGSPDWSGTYVSWLESYIWLSGAVLGLALGGVSLFAASTGAGTAPSHSRLHRLMLLASFLLPAAAFVVGLLVERSVMVPEKPIEVERCERLCYAQRFNAP